MGAKELTKPQLEALKIFPHGYVLAAGRYGNLYAELAKKGYTSFEGYEKGKRKFRLTEKGERELVALSSALPTNGDTP